MTAPLDNQRYLVDGLLRTEEEVRRLFSDGAIRLDNRQEKCLSMIEGESVVDVGCYTGGFVCAAMERWPSKDIVGVDYFDDNIRIAHLLYPLLRERIIKMSVYELQFGDDSIDCVTFQEVIEHLEGAALAIKEINRVLKPDGVLILSTTNPFYWRDLSRHLLRQLRLHILGAHRTNASKIQSAIFFRNVEWNRHIYNWTPDTLLALLEVNGFEYVDLSFSRDGSSRLERFLLRLFPFLGQVQIWKVRKTGPAPRALV